MITLPAKFSSDLEWDEMHDEEGVYHLDFGWGEIDPFNPVHLNANLFAVEEFAKKFPEAKKAVLAISSGQLANLFQFSEILQERAEESCVNFELFIAELFSEYLHRLASPLPEETIPVVLFDLGKESPIADLTLLLSKRRFQHLQIEFVGVVLPIEGDAPIAISLPQDFLYDPTLFESIFASLKGFSFKCIPEELLNEHWDGVDFIIVHKPSLGEIGKRMLLGFQAAGGEVIETGMPLADFIKKRG